MSTDYFNKCQVLETVSKILFSCYVCGNSSVRISCGDNGIVPLDIKDEVISYVVGVGYKVSGVVNSDDIVVWLKGK
jgi:hypothetical protein